MSSKSNPLGLEVFKGAKGIIEISEEWEALARRCRSSHLMQLPDYYLSYAKILAPTPNEMFVAAFFDNSGLVAVMPLRFSKRTRFGVSFGFLEFPNTPIPVRDFLFSDHIRFRWLVKCLKNQFYSVYGEQWDMMRLVGITWPIATIATPEKKPRIIITTVAKNNFIQLYDGDYVKDIVSTNMRSNLRRRMKKLKKLGHFEFKTISSLPELNDAYGAFVETEAAGWKSRRGGRRAIKLHPDQKAFFYDLMIRHAKVGRCHIHLLEVEGQAIASDFCLLAFNSVFSLKHGFNEVFSDVTPSNLLREYTIKYYTGKADFQSIDLISGYSWQERWKPASREVLSLVTFNHTLRGRLLQTYKQSKRHNSKR